MRMQPREPESRWQPHGDYPSPEGDRLEAQLTLIRGRFRSAVEPGPLDWPDAGVEFLVRRGFLTVAEEDYDEVRAFLVEREMADPLPRPDQAIRAAQRPADPWRRAPVPERVVDESAGVQQLQPADLASDLGQPPRDGSRAHGVRWIQLTPGTLTLAALQAIEDDGPDAEVSPEYVHHVTNTGGRCPADEPYPIVPGSPPDPPVTADRSAGAGVKVVVLDSGLDRDALRFDWMRDVTGDDEPGVGGGAIPPYAGHGTFIAGLIKTVAPRAEVVVRAAFPVLGLVYERDLVAALARTLRDDDPDVINLSAGTPARRATGPLLLNRFYDRVFRRYKGVVLVAAAGNDGRRERFWPAAAPWAVSVGALAEDWRSRASFSNFGSWVDAYAPGDRLVNAFRSGDYTYTEPPYRGQTVRFDGMARWSGTSFATPLVAGMIAARMSRTGENGPDAARALIRQAQRSALPGLGAVLRPGHDHGDHTVRRR
jgi:hypothetical protein